MIHESGAWSDIHNRWFFLPRRCSRDQYNETRDETMSCNVLLIADENFNSIKVFINSSFFHHSRIIFTHLFNLPIYRSLQLTTQ